VIVVAPDLVLGPVIADVPAAATGAVVAMDAVEAMVVVVAVATGVTDMAAVVAVATGVTDMAAEVEEVVMAGDVGLVLPPEAPGDADTMAIETILPNPKCWASSTSVSAPGRRRCKMFSVVTDISRR